MRSERCGSKDLGSSTPKQGNVGLASRMAGRQFASDSFGTFDVGGILEGCCGKAGVSYLFMESGRGLLFGHLAKYVPGKALVLVVRSSKLADQRFRSPPNRLYLRRNPDHDAVGATLGALGLFAKGGSTELFFYRLVWLWRNNASDSSSHVSAWTAMACDPKTSPFRFCIPREDRLEVDRFGWCLAGCGWLLQTIALWCLLLRGMVSSDLVTDWYGASLWNACLIAATLPVVAGFVSFMPAEQGFGSMS